MAGKTKRSDNHLRIGEMEIPQEYFRLSPEDKKLICDVILNKIYHLVERMPTGNLRKMDVMYHLIDSSIITNEEDENFEVCQVLKDVRNLLNEQKS
jgi:hypothetical protein